MATLAIGFTLLCYKLTTANIILTSISNDDSGLSSKIQEFHLSCPSSFEYKSTFVQSDKEQKNKKDIFNYSNKFGWSGWKQNDDNLYMTTSICKDISDNSGVWSAIGEIS